MPDVGDKLAKLGLTRDKNTIFEGEVRYKGRNLLDLPDNIESSSDIEGRFGRGALETRASLRVKMERFCAISVGRCVLLHQAGGRPISPTPWRGPYGRR